MSERVHPGVEAPESGVETAGLAGSLSKRPPLTPEAKPEPAPATYVIQVPKDQVYRFPPPENARRFKEYSRRNRRRRSCCCCLSWIAGVLLLLLLALAAVAGVIYLVFRPMLPNYTVENISIKGFNLTSDRILSPEFDVTVRAVNPNEKIGIYYRRGSSVVVSTSDADLCSGVWPAFYHGTNNVTVLRTTLTGSGIRLSDAMHEELVAEQSRRDVPLEIKIRVPVRVKFGAVTTWTITVKVRCVVTVDRLTESSRMVSKTCGVKVNI